MRRIHLPAFAGGLLIALLKALEYKHFVRAYPTELWEIYYFNPNPDFDEEYSAFVLIVGGPSKVILRTHGRHEQNRNLVTRPKDLRMAGSSSDSLVRPDALLHGRRNPSSVVAF